MYTRSVEPPANIRRLAQHGRVRPSFEEHKHDILDRIWLHFNSTTSFIKIVWLE